MKQILASIKNWWEKYLDFLYELPDGIGLSLFLASIIIPIIIVCTGIINILDYTHRLKCLDSTLARRWKNSICEEYYDSKWIKIDLSSSGYYYNEAASRK